MNKSQRTAEQILADLDSQFPKNTTVEEGKKPMARNTKAAKPQQDLKDIRSTLQMNQNKKLTPEDFGAVLTKAFGQKVQYELSKAITAITQNHHVRVAPQHIRFDYRGGWGKAVNVRAFIPQTFDGRGVWIRISMAVVNGVWDASTAKQYEDPHPYEGPAIEDPSADGSDKREEAPKASIPPSKHGMASVRSVNLVESERSGLVYVTVDVITGQLNRNDIVNVYDFEDKLVGEATVETLFRLDQHTLETVDTVETLNMGETGAVNFDATFHGNLSAGFKAYVSKPVVSKVATVEEATAPKHSIADLGRRSLHARPAMPASNLGLAVVVDMFKSPKGDVQGVDVMEGSVRVGDIIQVWRDGRYHVGGEIEFIRQYKDAVNEVGALGENRSCGLNIKFDAITDLKVGDKIFVTTRPGLADFSDVSISYTEDARGRNAIIDVTGRHRKDITDMSREAMRRLGVPVSDVPHVNGAVMEMYDMTANSNLAGLLTKLTVTLLYRDQLYPVAVRIEMLGKVGEVEGGIGTIEILDGQARRREFYGAGGFDYPSETIGRMFHGLVAYHILGQLLRDLDERDRADFETAYLETHRLGLAEVVKFDQDSNTVMSIWVEKSKYHASGYKVATLEFGTKGLERFHFFKMEEPTGPQAPTEITVEISSSDRFVMSGPIDANYVETIRKHIGAHNEAYVHRYTEALYEVKRIATNALVDNPDHWKDDQIVPWKAVMRFAQAPTKCFGKVAIVNMSDNLAPGFAIDFEMEGDQFNTTLVYGVGRYSNLLLLQGVDMNRRMGARVIATHLIDGNPVTAENLSNLIAGADQEGTIILAQVPERNAMVVILKGETADKDHVLANLDLVNGRIARWSLPREKLSPVKQQPQPHRHHHMDAEHSASSIVPRPPVNCSISNLIAYQAQTILRTLIVEEGDRPKFEMLNNFIEQCYKDAKAGGTGDALLYGVQFFEGRLSVDVKFIDVDGSHKPVADLAVYL